MTETDRATLPEVPARATLRAVASATVTRWTLGNLTSVIPMNRPGVWFGRGLIATIMETFGSMPGGTRIIPVRTPDLRGEWVLGPGVEFGNRAGYYVHGSAYVICSARTHRKLVARLSEATGLPMFVVDYRLAPEHRFPTSAEDVEAGYRWLLSEGYAASDIVMGADSAGGHLTCDMLLAHAGDADFRPAGVVLFSPLIDVTLGMALEQEKASYRDPAMSATAAGRMVGLYTQGQNLANPRLRLDFANADQLPPMLIQVGGFEMLRADARYLDAELRRAGGTSTLEVWPGMVHVFQALPHVAPEAGPALRRAAAFIADAYKRSDELEKVG
ncbi:alpha/beta hydrolase [Mycobacterium sp. CBMA293]|uniref:alpha/beta hydrolase n=1 Tax=unclassified Mycolicibacterium TaxID=2636767 RepID=UPI001327E7E6|nr:MULTISPECIES: alpha/beta hydrolase [unclassified Mycolicibacterium]MUL44444.1 alpha/beta hydrolase [Mycolicibacterium sp. CBMA 360]MUL94002.1 alpha/beta hydrolase [Mycolicibacterium sp. CBMA 230]MUL59764.1 alpha/beta hydrolase [Mycolicibacterium sp. CBMA 335]MUL68607.1 alpha/beta hydrolase [Mycolicibacterium sp. CBMA 311]MUM06248.1 alpha/beta hydrolase [Mycolicibacterium sp. CBMA 213]